jgi:hypothetical protein
MIPELSGLGRSFLDSLNLIPVSPELSGLGRPFLDSLNLVPVSPEISFVSVTCVAPVARIRKRHK